MNNCILISFTLLVGSKFQNLYSNEGEGLNLKRLEERVVALEKQNDVLRASVDKYIKKQYELSEKIRKLENPSTKNTSSLARIIPVEEEEKKSFFKTLQRELRSESDRESGPWTSPNAWTKIRKRMSSYEVRMTLGQPTNIKQSIKPSIEEVYQYQGDLNADGEIEKGVVNFKDNRVVSFESPHPD